MAYPVLTDSFHDLQMAIMTESKHFLASALVQEVINEIWSGRVLFSTASNHSLLADNYKARPIAAHHDPKGAPFLDHYRLRVPKYRSLIELLNFCILLFLFVLCLSSERPLVNLSVRKLLLNGCFFCSQKLCKDGVDRSRVLRIRLRLHFG